MRLLLRCPLPLDPVPRAGWLRLLAATCLLPLTLAAQPADPASVAQLQLQDGRTVTGNVIAFTAGQLHVELQPDRQRVNIPAETIRRLEFPPPPAVEAAQAAYYRGSLEEAAQGYEPLVATLTRYLFYPPNNLSEQVLNASDTLRQLGRYADARAILEKWSPQLTGSLKERSNLLIAFTLVREGKTFEAEPFLPKEPPAPTHELHPLHALLQSALAENRDHLAEALAANAGGLSQASISHPLYPELLANAARLYGKVVGRAELQVLASSQSKDAPRLNPATFSDQLAFLFPKHHWTHAAGQVARRTAPSSPSLP